MGRASRARTARHQSRDSEALSVRHPRRGDIEALAPLLQSVIPDVRGLAHARTIAPNMVGGFPPVSRASDGLVPGAAWVAEDESGVIGFTAAGPPNIWIDSLSLTDRRKTDVGWSVAMLEWLAVAPRARGRRVGHCLIESACRAMQRRGYRVAHGVVTRENRGLLPYYEELGFRTVGYGAPLGFHDPATGAVLGRVPDPAHTYIWRALHPDVTSLPTAPAATVLGGALLPPGGRHSEDRLVRPTPTQEDTTP